MKFRPFLPATSAALVVVAGVLIWQFSNTSRRGEPEGFRIGGRVTAEGGTPVEGTQVRVRWFEDGVVRGVTVPVRADGSFSAERLEPGVYSLAVIGTSHGGDVLPPTLASKDVAVTDRDVLDVRFTIAARR